MTLQEIPLVILIWSVIIWIFVKGPVHKKLIAIISGIISLIVVGSITTFLALTFEQQTDSWPDWLAAPVVFLIVGVFIRLTIFLYKVILRRYLKHNSAPKS